MAGFVTERLRSERAKLLVDLSQRTRLATDLIVDQLRIHPSHQVAWIGAGGSFWWDGVVPRDIDIVLQPQNGFRLCRDDVAPIVRVLYSTFGIGVDVFDIGYYATKYGRGFVLAYLKPATIDIFGRRPGWLKIESG